MNNLNIEELANNDKIIMLFESINDINPRGGKELLVNPPRHDGGYNTGFADGHAKYFKAEKITDEMWGERKQNQR